MTVQTTITGSWIHSI